MDCTALSRRMPASFMYSSLNAHLALERQEKIMSSGRGCGWRVTRFPMQTGNRPVFSPSPSCPFQCSVACVMIIQPGVMRDYLARLSCPFFCQPMIFPSVSLFMGSRIDGVDLKRLRGGGWHST